MRLKINVSETTSTENQIVPIHEITLNDFYFCFALISIGDTVPITHRASTALRLSQEMIRIRENS